MKLMVGCSNYIMEEWASINLVPNDPVFPQVIAEKDGFTGHIRVDYVGIRGQKKNGVSRPTDAWQ